MSEAEAVLEMIEAGAVYEDVPARLKEGLRDV